MQIVPYIDRTDLVDATIDKVSQTIFDGIGLVLHRPHSVPRQPAQRPDRWRHHPVRDGAAFILMNLTGMSANLLSLGAIDFGIIVDGAIVMTEAILRRREAKPAEPLTEDDARVAAAPGGAADLLRNR